MRLTLRTLLAYLDDRLPPGNAREIGKKISSSPFAQELADRIRTVVRQRRLTAPDRRVKLIDPNQIAEYLDDQLTPELVARIEKEILPSDFSLAEVAATHEILGLLGEPVELHGRLRERLVAMNPAPVTATEPAETGSTQPAQQEASDSDAWIPLPPQGRISKRSPVLLLTILFAGLFALIATDPVFFGGGDDVAVATVDPDVDKPADADQPPAPPQDPDARAPAPGPGTDASISGGNEVTGENDSQRSVANDQPDDDAREGAAAEHPAAVVAANQPELTDPTSDRSAAVIQPQAENPEAARPVAPLRDFSVNDRHGMLIVRHSQEDQWNTAESLVKTDEDWDALLADSILAVPTPFRPTVIPQDSGWKVTLLSPGLATFGGGVLQLFEGQSVVTGETMDTDSKRQLALVVGGTPILIDFSDPKTRFGIDVFAAAAERSPDEVAADNEGTSDDSAGDSTAADGTTDDDDSPPDTSDSAERASELSRELLPLNNAAIAGLYVAEGDVQVTILGGKPIAVAKGRSFHWKALTGTASDLRMSDPAQAIAIPDWVYSADKPDVEEVESLKAKIAEAIKAVDSPTDAALALSEDRNSQVAAYGASILTVTRRVDEMLVMLLSTSKDTVREESIRGLRQVAAQTVYGEEQVLKALETRLPMREIDDTLTLLYGLTPSQLEVGDLSEWLVMMLQNERPAIRQLAIMNLEAATGQTMGFHPDSDPNRRREAIRRWEKLLKRNGNRLIVPQ